jgi:hypothetical protein
MRYSCGCRADLSIVTREQVRAARTCYAHSPDGRIEQSRNSATARENRRRSEDLQARLDEIDMGHMGPLADERIRFTPTATPDQILKTFATLGAMSREVQP